MSADAFQHARQGLLTALVCWWIRHPERTADHYTQGAHRRVLTGTPLA